MQSPELKPNRTPLWFWILGLVLIGYVAACTVQRENELGSDAWEHHRALAALVRQLWKPGNPTYASDLPSVRYSPYLVGWALVCRATGISPYAALSIAAVVNTALLIIGLWMFLASFGEQAAAGAVLVVMVCLYGSAPGWANSYALSDLPWQQVNPSAFSFALTLISWAIFRRTSTGRGRLLQVAAVVALLTIAMLDHGMTGAFGIVGLFVLTLAAPGNTRMRTALLAMAITICVGALCLLWPWYPFLTAVRWHQDQHYWFSASFLHQELTEWIVPAVLCSLFALPLRERPMVRTCIIGGTVSLGAGIIARFTHSPVLSRFPLPGLIYFHILAGLFAHESGIFRPSTWPARLKGLMMPLPQAAYPILQTVLAIVLLYCLVPQFRSIATEPYLARVYLARLTGRADHREHLRQDLAALLQPVGQDDVVLSNLGTSWLIPSVRGKIVAAMHYELFVPDQRQRWHDDVDFFTTAGERQRQDVLRKYHVRWIVLNRRNIDASSYDALFKAQAVEARAGDLVLMRASKWLSD